MRFEWDSEKAKINFVKHGVRFDDALTAFDDPYGFIDADPKHSFLEVREKIIGESVCGLLVIIFTMREDDELCRIISARKANKREKQLYAAFRYF